MSLQFDLFGDSRNRILDAGNYASFREMLRTSG